MNAYPSSGGSGSAGAILKGDTWSISVAGTLPTGQVVEIGDIVRALINTPGNTQANWAITQNNIGYVAENSANKDTDGTLSANSDIKYASQKATKTYADNVSSNASVIAKLLIGFASGAGTITAADSILTAFNKIVGNIALKLTANVSITPATKTKITYDANGLVTSGADATTADIADSANKRYVTDADLVDIGNLSGVNTGDQTVPVVANPGEVADSSTVAEADGTSPRFARGDHVHKYVDTGGGGGVAYGAITGTVRDQVDLQLELDAKADNLVMRSYAAKMASLKIYKNTNFV